jgi:HSP20 family protein
MLVRRVRPLQPTLDGSLSNFDPVRRELLRSFSSSVDDTSGAVSAEVFPRMHLSQDDENLYLLAEMPGVDPDQLSISALRNSVSLAGKRVRRAERPEDGLERTECAFDCTVALPAEVDAERMDAGYCDGILAVTLPKARRSLGPGRC